MKLSEARILYNAGALKSATLYRSIDNKGWSLRFDSERPLDISLVLETQKGAERVFKSSDAGLLALEKIGFTSATILLDKSS